MLASISLASALVAVVAAQSTTSAPPASTVSQSMPATATQAFNPNNVTSTDRFNWCHAQQNTCPMICGGQTSVNSCDQNSLTYQCTCLNGTTPDCTAFTETLPFYICEATYIQCINNNPNNAEGQQVCTNNEKCGSRNASLLDTTQSTSSSASSTASSTSVASSSGTASGTGSATASSASASSTAKSDAGRSQQLATGAFAAVMLAAFKLLL